MDHQMRSLSGQRRFNQIDQASVELQSFLDRLEDPLIRRFIRDPKSLTLEERARWVTDVEVHRSLRDARQQYERLAIRVPDEWTRYKKTQWPEYIAMIEWVLLGRLAPTRGAPKKSRENSEDYLISREVDAARERLRPGREVYDKRKKAGGSQADDEEIRPELTQMGYDEFDIRALFATRALLSAAKFRVAEQTGKTPRTINASVSRARLPTTGQPTI
jgi:hypothetical protein